MLGEGLEALLRLKRKAPRLYEAAASRPLNVF